MRDARSGDRAAVAEEQWLRQVIEALQAGKPARTVPVPHDAPDALRNLYPLTGKPVLFVANVNEGEDAVPSVVADHAAATGAAAVAISSRIEADLADLGDDEEAAMMREELGIGESGLHRVVNGAFGLLHLIAFFTAGEGKPAQTWHLREGLTAWHAAGQIHSDIQKGFVRAEVIGWDALVEAGGYAGARDKGTLRLEGRDYLMTDGDVLTVKFTPCSQCSTSARRPLRHGTCPARRDGRFVDSAGPPSSVGDRLAAATGAASLEGVRYGPGDAFALRRAIAAIPLLAARADEAIAPPLGRAVLRADAGRDPVRVGRSDRRVARSLPAGRRGPRAGADRARRAAARDECDRRSRVAVGAAHWVGDTALTTCSRAPRAGPSSLSP